MEIRMTDTFSLKSNQQNPLDQSNKQREETETDPIPPAVHQEEQSLTLSRKLFIMNQEIERLSQDLDMSVGVMKH